MSTDAPPGKNKIFTEEAADAARALLKAFFAKQELERDAERFSRDQDVEGAESLEDAEPEEARIGDADDQENDIDDLFPFMPAERPLIDQIERTIRRLMLTADPASLRDIAVFLHVLQRLPYATPDVSLDVALMERVEENLSYVSVELDGQSFRLSSGGSVYSPDVGSDSYSSTTFQIELGGFREGTTQDFGDWLGSFVSASGAITIQGDSDTDMTDIAPEDGWERLDKYWEDHWEDEDGY